NVLRAASGALPQVSVYGTSHPTPDGTAIRDYVHVSDLAAAHVLALRHLRAGGASERINLGTGRGHSVLEVIEAARRVTGRAIAVRAEPPRPGDPPALVANADRARRLLGWTPAHARLEALLESAWKWHLAHPRGYER